MQRDEKLLLQVLGAVTLISIILKQVRDELLPVVRASVFQGDVLTQVFIYMGAAYLFFWLLIRLKRIIRKFKNS